MDAQCWLLCRWKQRIEVLCVYTRRCWILSGKKIYLPICTLRSNDFCGIVTVIIKKESQIATPQRILFAFKHAGSKRCRLCSTCRLRTLFQIIASASSHSGQKDPLKTPSRDREKLLLQVEASSVISKCPIKVSYSWTCICFTKLRSSWNACFLDAGGIRWWSKKQLECVNISVFLSLVKDVCRNLLIC